MSALSNAFLLIGLVALTASAFLVAIPFGGAVLGCSALALSWATRPREKE